MDQDFEDGSGVGFSRIDYGAAGGVPSAAVETRSGAVKEREAGVAYAETAHDGRFQAGMP